MRRRTLRGRLNAVLLQWFLLVVVVSGTVVVFSVPAIRKTTTDDRLLLAQTIAHSFDATISSAIQNLGRLSADLPEADSDLAARFRVFRFQSPFSTATYLLDARGEIIAADPPEAQPIPTEWLGYHETATPLVRKAGTHTSPALAIVHPFRRAWRDVYLVAEMNPFESRISRFLQDLGPDLDMHVAVVDENGVVVASRDPMQLYREMTDATSYRERIRAHRPITLDGVPCSFEPAEQAPIETLTVMVPLRSAPWGVVIQQHEAEAFAGFYSEWRGLTLAAVLLAAMTLLLSTSISRSVVAPIRQLSRQAAAVRAGDLSTPITVTGDEEVESLAQTLDEARSRLSSTLGELKTLNETLEGQVAARTRTIEAKYHDLALLHAVAELSIEEREPDRLAPGMLRIIAAHYGFEAAAIVTTPKARRAVTYVVPADASLPWLDSGIAPSGWRQHDIVYQDRAVATFFHPHRDGIDEQVMESLTNHLAMSLHRANLWKRALEQDEQRQVLVRRLLGAAEDERRRLARELHDEISQLLTVIQLSLARVDTDSPELTRARELLTKTQVDMHRIIHDLRPSLLDDLGLAAAIRSHAHDHLVREGLEVSLEIEEPLPSRPAIETAVFRIYQELVTNILRHSRAGSVSIELYEGEGTLVLAVEDDGVGFDPDAKSEGVGITGMHERASLVGGTITFDSEPGMGTHVVLEIPVA